MCVCLKKASCWAAVTVGLWQWCYQGSRHLPTFSTWQLSALGLHRPAALCGPSFALQQARIFASFSLEHGPFFSTLNPTSLNSFLDFHTFSRSFLWLKTAKKLSSVKIFPFFCLGPRPIVHFLPLLDAQVAVNLWALASVVLENGGKKYTAHI